MEATLSPALVDQVLERLGLDRRPAVDLEGLNELYGGWSISFDNVQKRIALEEGRTVLPGTTAEGFFENFLAHGTGGTCWPTSGALHALLTTLGFPARRGTGAMMDHRAGPVPNHGTTFIRLDGKDTLADTWMLTGRTIPLAPGQETRIEDALNPVRAEPVGRFWRVWTVRPHDSGDLPCLILDDDVEQPVYEIGYRDSRIFSHRLYARRNTPDGVLVLLGSTRYFRDAAGQISAIDAGMDRGRVLVEEFGFSEEVVSRLPADVEPDPIPLGERPERASASG